MTSAAYINFMEAPSSVDEPVTKFGGSPCWLEQPHWPLSQTTGRPMCFIGQVALDQDMFLGSLGRMAYIFMTSDEDEVDGTYDPEGGENAVIIQPGNICLTEVENIPTGPALEGEYLVELHRSEDCSAEHLEQMLDTDSAGYDQLSASMSLSKIGGTPYFIQGEEYPEGEDWVLLLQLNSEQAPFDINFGDAGIGYVFINKRGDSAKFLWQCY